MQIPCFNNLLFFEFIEADYFNIYSFISNFDWPSTLSDLSFDLAFNTLYDAFNQSVLCFVPIHYFKKSTYPDLFTKELKEILFLKKKTRSKFKSTFNTRLQIFFIYVAMLIELSYQLIQILTIFGNL